MKRMIVLLLCLCMACSLPACANQRGTKKPSREYSDADFQFPEQPAIVQGIVNNPDDVDCDGLSNEDEAKYGTSTMSADTDDDGLGDAYEVNISLTDPTASDTDKDTLGDAAEVKAGLDPLNPTSDGTTNDADRTFSVARQEDYFRIDAKGNAEVYNTYCNVFSVSGLANTPGVMSEAYEIYHPSGLQNTTITFTYKDSALNLLSLTPEDLSIAKFNADGTFTELTDCSLDTNHNHVSAKVTENGKYVLCHFNEMGTAVDVSVMILMDNSGSMYHDLEIGDNKGADTEFKRLDMATAIVNELSSKTTHFGLAKFTKEYTTLAKLGSSAEEVLAAIEGIRTGEENFTGTYLASALVNGSYEFGDNEKNHRKFIIILTDGATTEGSSYFDWNEYDAIKHCNGKGITVIAIALGSKTDASYLRTITEGTGGTYLYANNADALPDIYEALQMEMKYSSMDINKDGEIDSFVVADTGFDMQYNAFNFANFTPIVPDGYIQAGVCHGMAMFAQGFYRDKYDILKGAGFTIHDVRENGTATVIIPPYDVTNALEGIDSLREYKCDIMEKIATINSLPKDEKYELRNGYPHFKKSVLEKYGDEYLVARPVSGSGTWQGTSFDQFEILYVDLEKYMEQDVKRDDMEVLLACYWLWATQVNTPSGYQKEMYELDGTGIDFSNENELQFIIDKMEDGIPLTVGFDTSATSGHAITAMRMFRDFYDPFTYYLECYDNNTLAEPYLFKICLSDMNLWNRTNASNWGKNYSVRPYRLVDGEWEAISLRFYEVYP